MTTDDRDLLFALRRQQDELQRALDGLRSQLRAVEARVIAPGVFLPPIPTDDATAPLPPIPAPAPLPPLPYAPEPGALPPLPSRPLPPIPPARPSLEHHAGWWLTRIGLTLVGLSVLFLAVWIDLRLQLHGRLGPLARFGFGGLASALAYSAGRRIERRSRGVSWFGPTLAVAGLAGLWFVFFAAHFVPSFTFIHSPLLAGVLEVTVSLYILYQAEKRRSALLGAFGITLACVATACNEDTSFVIFTELLLASTSAAFLMRNGWALMATISLVGSHVALVRRLLVDPEQGLVLDTSRLLPYGPHALYLTVTWSIFTVASILALAPEFRGGRRLAFVSLNNAAFVVLLALTTYITGYDLAAMGWTLFNLGLVFLVVSRLAGYAAIDPVELMGAYAAQGLALFTAGVIIVFTGFSRALALLVETFLLGVAGAFAGDRILMVSTYVVGFFATIFCLWQIALYAHHPWLLGFGGALVMLINAWSSRGEVRHSPAARSSIVVSTTCYCVLAIGLISAALGAEMSPGALPAALASMAVVLTFAIYYFSIFELPVLAQLLLVAALVLVLFPVETGEDLPLATLAWVGAVTLGLTTWWARQRITLARGWRQPLLYLYALAVVALAVNLVQPFVDAQGWIIAASLLALSFAAYGALFRTCAVAVMGQVLLLLALYHFFLPPDRAAYPWAWWAAAVPVLATFFIGRAAQRWLDTFLEMDEDRRGTLFLVAQAAKLLALAGLVRWIFGVVPAPDRMGAFIFFGTFLVSFNVRQGDRFGIRCSFVLSLIGFVLALVAPSLSWASLFAGALFLAQVPLLQPDGRRLVTPGESGALLIAATIAGWAVVSSCCHGHDLTLGWALYALALFIFGLATGDRRLRMGGLIVLGFAILRVLGIDMWTLSAGYRILTLFLLALVMLVVGFSLVQQAPPRAPRRM